MTGETSLIPKQEHTLSVMSRNRICLGHTQQACVFHILQHLKPKHRPLSYLQMKSNKCNKISSQIKCTKTIFRIFEEDRSRVPRSRIYKQREEVGGGPTVPGSRASQEHQDPLLSATQPFPAQAQRSNPAHPVTAEPCPPWPPVRREAGSVTIPSDAQALLVENPVTGSERSGPKAPGTP